MKLSVEEVMIKMLDLRNELVSLWKRKYVGNENTVFVLIDEVLTMLLMSSETVKGTLKDLKQSDYYKDF